MFQEAEIIYAYTREQAIKDGVLIDITETAKEMGFNYPVAITDTAWNGVCLLEAQTLEERTIYAKKFQQTILRRLKHSITTHGRRLSDRILFSTPFTADDGQLLILKSVCSPGDTLDPVLTIMLPDED